LDAAYIRPTSVVYNRHHLITTKQDAGQTIDAYLQNLQRVAKSCNFEAAVSAEENKNQYVRDAFINGISSANIRQRLLENVGELSLQQACTQARALEQTQNQSASYDHHSNVAAMDEQSDQSIAVAGRKNKNYKNNYPSTQQTNKTTPNQKTLASFVVILVITIALNVACDDECLNCKKKGHWSRMCKSKTAIASIGTNNIDVLPQHQFPQQSNQHQIQNNNNNNNNISSNSRINHNSYKMSAINNTNIIYLLH
jgi:nitric oxide reductase large subunit